MHVLYWRLGVHIKQVTLSEMAEGNRPVKEEEEKDQEVEGQEYQKRKSRRRRSNFCKSEWYKSPLVDEIEELF